MKNSKLITRAVIATSFLVTLAVPVASAYSENSNLGNSEDVRQDGYTEAATAENNGNGVGRPDTWGGCRGRHGNYNPGQGQGPGANGNSSNAGGNGNGNAYGLVKQNSCGGGTPDPDEDVEGSNYTLPQTR
jgi:hypothetical protein